MFAVEIHASKSKKIKKKQHQHQFFFLQNSIKLKSFRQKIIISENSQRTVFGNIF